MKKIIFFTFLLVSLSTFAQNGSKEDADKKSIPLAERITILEEKNAKLSFEVTTLKTTISEWKKKPDNSKDHGKINNDTIRQVKEELEFKIAEVEEITNQQISDLNDSLQNTLFGVIIGALLILILLGIAYRLLSKKQKSDQADLMDQLSKVKSTVEENRFNEFGKLTELMETQSEALQLQKPNPQPQPQPESDDHSLALKVATEINTIERNINRMDPGIKGLKQVVHSLEKLKDNLSANGYEMPALLGKPFHEGMKVIVANSIPDEKLEKGAEIISKILIPQVNYNGIMIQTAEIEVSIGY